MRHHDKDFERMAFGTGQTWRQVVDVSMEAISRDPDVVKPARGGQTCRSRVIYLNNKKTGKEVRRQIVVEYDRPMSDGPNVHTRTVFPRGKHCA